jgi:hypothetical protein
MIKHTLFAGAVAILLTGCHAALLAVPVAITVAKDVLEIDVTAKQLFQPPPPSPAAIP